MAPETEIETPQPEPEQAVEAAPETPEVVEPVDPVAAFDKGVAEASDTAAEPEPETPAEPEPEQPAPEAPAPAAETPEAPKDVDAEIQALGLKERAAERFKELTSRVAEVEQLRPLAERANEWEQMVSSTKATPQQFANAMSYLSAVNSGDPEKMVAAYEGMQKELQWMGQKLGREAPGFDPLTAHADLKARVDAGDLPRDVATEIVQQRQRAALQQEHTQTQQQEWQRQQIEQQGLAQVAALGQQIKASDPEFERKFAFLAPTLNIIQQSLPPDRWATEIHKAYLALPAMPAAAPAQRPVAAARPVRSSGAPSLAAKPKSDIEAFEMGVATLGR